MSVFLVILWVVGAIVSLGATYVSFGWTLRCQYFPEGKRWWMPVVKLASISAYTALIIFRPF